MEYKIRLKPRSERESQIRKHLEAHKEAENQETDTLDDFRGKRIELPVVEVDIDLPVYRMSNCRTYSEQQNAIALKELGKSFFDEGQEVPTVQAEQHQILRKITTSAKESIADIDEVLEIEGQREPILVTSTGVVVNGNRRLGAMRELYTSDKKKFARFAWVRCAILPSDTTADEIDDIEATLQARPQTKLDYDWIGDARLVRRQINKRRTIDEVATQLRRKPNEIKILLQALDEAELYLTEWLGKPGQFGLVTGDAEQLFKDLSKQITGRDVPMQNAVRAIAWSLYDNRDQLSGRVYGYNAAFGKLASEVIALTSEELKIEAVGDKADEDGDFEFEIEDDDAATDYEGFIAALKEDSTKGQAIEALIEASTTAIERERGKKNKTAALKALSQIHSKLIAVDVASAGPGTFSAMQKQVSAINDALVKLDQELAQAIAKRKE